jgi:hypothetical protein
MRIIGVFASWHCSSAQRTGATEQAREWGQHADGRQIPTSAGRGAGTVGRPHIDLISIGDVVKYRLEQMKHESEAMREYIVNTWCDYLGLEWSMAVEEGEGAPVRDQERGSSPTVPVCGPSACRTGVRQQQARGWQ